MSEEKRAAIEARANEIMKAVDPSSTVKVDVVYQVSVTSHLRHRNRQPLYDAEYTLLEEFSEALMDFQTIIPEKT
jgi:hypothetical protein